ncbi:hypothetical protein ACFJGW_00495 [Burkholderiaceae bacterium UC74_6]
MSIIYIEKGAALHAAIAAAGHWLRCDSCEEAREDGDPVTVHTWVSSDDVAVQEIIDSYSLADARAPIIAAVKELARVKILGFLPEWKQSNCNARMNELNLIRFSRALTDDEAAEVSMLQAIWDEAKAVRDASNAIEAALTALDSFEAITAFDINVGWPV